MDRQETKFRAKTLEGQLNMMLKSIGDVSNKLQEARKAGYTHEVNQYKIILRDKIDAYQELRHAAGI